jgi:hypothetical chaperone protein
MATCGLDFGTSNTTLGIYRDGGPVLCELEAGETTLPSAIFYETNGQRHIGRAAIEAYIDGINGRLMRSLKSVLGSSLIKEKTQIGVQRASFRDVIAQFLTDVKQRAEAVLDCEITSVLHGRPVHFVDGNDEADQRAEATLREIAHEVGFQQVSFEYEPIAAALEYEQKVTSEQLVVIADIGGGTSDFSIVRVSPERRKKVDRSEDILANDGIRIGGTDFDRELSLYSLMPLLGYRAPLKRKGLNVPSGYFHDLATWHTINRLYDSKVVRGIREIRRDAVDVRLLDRLIRVINERRGHELLAAAETAKIDLASMADAEVLLGWIEEVRSIRVTHEDLETSTGRLAAGIAARVDVCMKQAGLNVEDIDALVLTGGSTRLSHVRRAIAAALPKTKLVEGDTFGSVGLGLTIGARQRFGPGEVRKPSRAFG